MGFKRLEAIVSIRGICKECGKEVSVVVDLDDFEESFAENAEEYLQENHVCQLPEYKITYSSALTNPENELWKPRTLGTENDGGFFIDKEGRSFSNSKCECRADGC
jgi:hypothetical protein